MAQEWPWSVAAPSGLVPPAWSLRGRLVGLAGLEVTGQVYQATPYPPFMMALIEAGGLVAYTRQKRKT